MELPKIVWRWAFYDFANSSYVLIFQAFLLPVFFSSVLLARGYSLTAWGTANGISTVIGVILAIIMGRYADKRGKYGIFKGVVLVCFLGMVGVAWSVGAFLDGVFYFYIFTNALFIASLSLSDSMLPHISDSRTSYEYSGFAWGFGYMGGILSLFFVIILQKVFSEYSPIVFLSVAVFYLLFALHAWRGLKLISLNKSPQVKSAVTAHTYKQKIPLLVGYWLISESITVIILFFSIFAAQDLGLSNAAIGVSLLVVQLVGFPATWYGGRLAGKFNNLWLLGISIALWAVIIVLMISSPSLPVFVFIVLLTGLTIGNSQSLIRAQYATVVDRSDSGFQFGVYSFISQAAVSIGPIMYGMASDYLKSQKAPMLILLALMVCGFVIVCQASQKIKPDGTFVTNN